MSDHNIMRRDGYKSGFVRLDQDSDFLLKALSKKDYNLPKGLRSHTILVPGPSNQSYDTDKCHHRQGKSEQKIHGQRKNWRYQRDGNDFRITNNEMASRNETEAFETCNDLVCLKFPTLEDFIKIRHVDRNAKQCAKDIEEVEEESKYDHDDDDDDWTIL